MFFDWLGREGGIFVTWWMLVTLMGVAVFPLCVRLLSGLPDRGYTITRSVGVLLVAFVFWLLASLGFLPNTTGSIVIAWVLIFCLSLFAYFGIGERIPWRDYWQENKRVIVVTEILFVVLFFGWMVFRAYQNDTSTTEKPMDLMFISSIMRSPTFPPNDGWMSGFSISYYHFGYVMSAMMSKLSNVTSPVGFSMTLALWFAMTGINAFGVVYNLVRSRAYHYEVLQGTPLPRRIAPIFAGLLATIFIVLLGNFQLPLIELPWQSAAGTAEYYNYWGTQNRIGASTRVTPDGTLLTNPSTWDYWWWFRSSRVLNDVQLDGSAPPSWYAQPIDEFPNFSFVLGDSHPHVLALPFGLMALGLALNVLLAKRNPNLYDLLFYGVTIGSFIFLNTWDILAYFGAFIGADALRRLMKNDKGRLSVVDWVSLVGDALTFFVVAFLAYGLFLYSFRSQAGGLTVNLLYPTYFPQFFIQFGPFLLILGAFLGVEIWRGRYKKRMNWVAGVGVVGSVALVIALVVLVFVVRMSLDPSVNSMTQNFVNDAGGWSAVFPQFLMRRLTYLPTTLFMMLAIVMIVARLFPRFARFNDNAPTITYSHATVFALLLVAIGAVLIIIPEFVYLVDVFSSRINTIFKFYYQVWVLWGIASAFATYSLLSDLHFMRPAKSVRYFFLGMLALILFMGLLYPLLAIYSRMFVEGSGAVITIDGSRNMVSADDYAMIQCFNQVVGTDNPVVVEAVRDAYNPSYGRVASLTGIPILLGWENHENQWRGSTYRDVVGTRSPDIANLYNSADWDIALEVIEKYGIDYIVYGQTERRQYEPSGEQKFIDHLSVICQSGDSKIYRVSADLAPVAPQ